uniref:Uncharacterized protein n=1 Tax=uncultured proteobacterium DelRiverFos06H03 TaxID=311783 RepID=Q58PL9_9PROT|nr:hypothetical protein DelRiverFos06H03.32 [uncultured proteobacterium DelRiverFos06H03]
MSPAMGICCRIARLIHKEGSCKMTTQMPLPHLFFYCTPT